MEERLEKAELMNHKRRDVILDKVARLMELEGQERMKHIQALSDDELQECLDLVCGGFDIEECMKPTDPLVFHEIMNRNPALHEKVTSSMNAAFPGWYSSDEEMLKVIESGVWQFMM